MGDPSVVFNPFASSLALQQAFASDAFVAEGGQSSLRRLEGALRKAQLGGDFYERVVRYRRLLARGKIVEARILSEGIARSLAVVKRAGPGTSRFAGREHLIAAITAAIAAASKPQGPTPVPLRDQVAIRFGALYLRGVSEMAAHAPRLVGPGFIRVYSLDPRLRVDAQEWLEILAATFEDTVESVLLHEKTSEVVIRVYRSQWVEPIAQDRLMSHRPRRRVPRPQLFYEAHLDEVYANEFLTFSVSVREWRSNKGKQKVWQRFLNRLKGAIFGLASD